MGAMHAEDTQQAVKVITITVVTIATVIVAMIVVIVVVIAAIAAIVAARTIGPINMLMNIIVDAIATAQTMVGNTIIVLTKQSFVRHLVTLAQYNQEKTTTDKYVNIEKPLPLDSRLLCS